jgi:hypothetical protein
MDDFKEYYVDVCRKNPKEASLFALSSLSMRHITKKDLEYYNDIKIILFKELKDESGPELDKVREIIISVEKYDDSLIEHLSSMEKVITNLIKSKNNFKCQSIVEKQKENIKKWWE